MKKKSAGPITSGISTILTSKVRDAMRMLRFVLGAAAGCALTFTGLSGPRWQSGMMCAFWGAPAAGEVGPQAEAFLVARSSSVLSWLFNPI
jgi:hypothetical protein